MSLDNIQLPAIAIQHLFQNTLISNAETGKLPAANLNILNFLGGNNSNIAILVNNPGVTYLSDTQLSFLTDILNACKLNLNDVGVINFYQNKKLDHKHLARDLKPKVILLFGVFPNEIDLPFTIPEFQIQSFNNQKYITAPALEALQNDADLKKKLWESLKQLFL